MNDLALAREAHSTLSFSGRHAPPRPQKSAVFWGSPTPRGLAFGSLSLCLASLYGHALRAAVVPPLADAERRATRAEVARWRFACVVAGVSLLAALALPAPSPGWLLGMPGMAYGLLMATPWVVRRHLR